MILFLALLIGFILLQIPLAFFWIIWRTERERWGKKPR